MREFVARENIKRFEGQLASCTDPEQREILSGLLQEARQQLAEAEAEKRAALRRYVKLLIPRTSRPADAPRR